MEDGGGEGELILSGKFVYGRAFEDREGYIVIKDGTIKETGAEAGVEGTIKGFIIPSFINAHTHIGDSVAKEPDFMPLAELVGPGGFKERILAETPYEVLLNAMKDTISDIFGCGIQLFGDFREGGLSGINVLKSAFEASGMKSRLRMKIFGRPGPGDDADTILGAADGIGMSSTADWSWNVLKDLADAARSSGKVFALHAGERNSDDIEDAIELEPDFIVHLTKASRKHFQRMYDRDIGAVVCLRSNMVTGMGVPPICEMLDSGLIVGVGTDNVMLNSPDMFHEMEFISKLLRLDEREILKMCTWNSARILKGDKIGLIEEGMRANLVVIRADTPNMSGVRNWLRGVVRRATRADIGAILYEGKPFKPFYHASHRKPSGRG